MEGDRDRFRQLHDQLRIPVDKAARSRVDSNIPISSALLDEYLRLSWEVFSETVRYEHAAEWLAERQKKVEWDGFDGTCLYCGMTEDTGHAVGCEGFYADGTVRQ